MLVLMTAMLLVAAGTAHAQEQAIDLAPVDIVEVNGLIDEIVVNDIEQAIDRAENSTSQAIILQVNSHGGVVSAARLTQLFDRIINSKLPIGVWDLRPLVHTAVPLSCWQLQTFRQWPMARASVRQESC